MMNAAKLERGKKFNLLQGVFIIFLFVLQPFSKHLINVHLAVVGKNRV